MSIRTVRIRERCIRENPAAAIVKSVQGLRGASCLRGLGREKGPAEFKAVAAFVVQQDYDMPARGSSIGWIGSRNAQRNRGMQSVHLGAMRLDALERRGEDVIVAKTGRGATTWGDEECGGFEKQVVGQTNSVKRNLSY